jgi:hypothetical protein
LLKLSAFRLDAWASGGAGCTRGSEVSGGRTGILPSSEEHGVGASGAQLCELINGQALAACCCDAGAGTFCEFQGSDSELGHLETVQSNVISNSADNHSDLLALGLHVSDDASQTQGNSVHSAGIQSLQDHGIETTVSSAGEKRVQLQASRHQRCVAIRQTEDLSIHRIRILQW